MTLVEKNVATSKNEDMNAPQKVYGMVLGVGSLSNTFSEANKDDVNADGVGSSSVFLSTAEQVQMCANLEVQTRWFIYVSV